MNEVTVNITGIPVYILTNSGGEFTGESLGINMGIISGISMVSK
jgi:hypothetical protein